MYKRYGQPISSKKWRIYKCSKSTWKGVFVNEQEPMGLSWDRPLRPMSSALAPFWSTWITVSEAHFLSCFTDAKTPTKWKKVTTWWPSAQPTGAWGLIMLTLVSPPCYFTINQSENCATKRSHPTTPLCHLAFKIAWLKAMGEFRCFEP